MKRAAAVKYIFKDLIRLLNYIYIYIYITAHKEEAQIDWTVTAKTEVKYVTSVKSTEKI